MAHSAATVLAVALTWRCGFGGAWWVALAWYLTTFVGFHAVMIPIMTAWHAFLDSVERRVRSIIEEEMIRVDLRNYEKQLRRVFPGRDTSES